MQPAPLSPEVLVATNEAGRQAEQEVARQQSNTLGDGIAGALDAGSSGAFDLVGDVVGGAVELVGNLVCGLFEAL